MVLLQNYAPRVNYNRTHLGFVVCVYKSRSDTTRIPDFFSEPGNPKPYIRPHKISLKAVLSEYILVFQILSQGRQVKNKHKNPFLKCDISNIFFVA